MIYNTIWSRLAAAIIDSLLLSPLVLFGNSTEPGKWDLITVVVIVLHHSYYIIGHAQYGQTLGKRLLGVKVVRAHEHLPLTWKHAILRELLWIALTVLYSFITKPEPLLLLPGLAIAMADCLMAIVHPRHRSLRDFIAKTVVIRIAPAAS